MEGDPKITRNRADEMFNSFARVPGAEPPAQSRRAESQSAPQLADARLNEPSSGELPRQIGPGVKCSDCRTILRREYFTVHERPVCARCREPYVKMLARGTGREAFWRATEWGSAVAIACALVLGFVNWMPFLRVLRIFLAIGVGYAVGRTVSRATGGYGGRRYQALAIALTYFAIGLSYMPGAWLGFRSGGDVRSAAIGAAEGPSSDAKPARSRAVEGDARAPATVAATPAPEPDILAADNAPADSAETADSVREKAVRDSVAAQQARKSAGPGLIGTLAFAIVMLLGLPILAVLAGGIFNIYGAVIGIFAMGFGIYKAWDLTSQGVEFEMSGPYQVGSGPIKPTV